MASLDTRPDTVDITHYAGDTLTIKVTAPDALVAGRGWTAQIRADRAATTVDASFTITPPTVADGPAYLVLPAAESARLAGTGTRKRVVRSGVAVLVATYSGVWDCQVADPLGDPVTTLVQGSITIEADVSRLP